MGFEPPTSAERLKAIGSTANLPEVLQKAFDPGADFDPIPAPGPHDWQANHPEPGQAFEEYVRSSPNRPDARRTVIYLQPLGDFAKDKSPPLERLRDYAGAFFSMKVKILPSIDISGAHLTSRRNPHTGNRQIQTGGVLNLVRKTLPDDAFCLLAITMEDLYPDERWNFVFGEASLRQRVGVYSFARYDPLFYKEPRGKDYEKLILRRSCKVLAHETGHMFGLQHCIHFRCLLNGSNHLGESDSRPMHLCPVCLRKLQYAVGLDVPARYRDLLRFYKEGGFDDEARWMEQRITRITGEATTRPATKAR